VFILPHGEMVVIVKCNVKIYYILTGEIQKNINKIKVRSFTSEHITFFNIFTITRDYFYKN